MVKSEEKEVCFVIMPISDPSNYCIGHFAKVYEQIFKPAIIAAGYEPKRVDEDKASGLIQAKILKQLIDAPMVLCDLSSRNPNVLFELGLRQAFDMPVTLVQEIGTERVFDIASIKVEEYRNARIYDEVIEDQKKITDAIIQTRDNGKFNSLIKLIEIDRAVYNKEALSAGDQTTMMLYSITEQLKNLDITVRQMQRSDVYGREFKYNSVGMDSRNPGLYTKEIQIHKDLTKMKNRLANGLVPVPPSELKMWEEKLEAIEADLEAEIANTEKFGNVSENEIYRSIIILVDEIRLSLKRRNNKESQTKRL